ncbi:MAG: hypothetical protein ACKOPU_05675 [Candidatus Planktophila sp.]
MREKLIQNVSKMQSRITDLQDMLDDGVPMSMQKKIRDEIEMLSDMIFYDQEILENY